MGEAGKTLNQRPSDRALRAAGALYLLLVVTSIFGFFVPQTLVVTGDATATANKIATSETLFRLAITSGLTAAIAFIFLARALYQLLNHVNKAQASLMVMLVTITVPLSFVTSLNQVAALTIIHGGTALAGFETAQIDSLAMLFLQLSSNVSSVNSIFFGLWLLPLAVLVIQSRFIPQVIGYLLIVAGCSYLIGSLTFLLAPPYRSVISGIVTVGYLGEFGIVGWLAVSAVRIQFGSGTGSR